MVNAKTFKTLEFLLLVLANAGGWLLAVADYMPERYAVYATAGSAALYAIWRGLAKMNADTRDYWHTSEFWIGLLATIPTAIAALSDVIPPNVYGILQASILAALGLGAGFRKQPEVAAGVITAADALGETDLLVTDDGYDPADDADDSELEGTPLAAGAPAVEVPDGSGVPLRERPPADDTGK